MSALSILSGNAATAVPTYPGGLVDQDDPRAFRPRARGRRSSRKSSGSSSVLRLEGDDVLPRAGSMNEAGPPEQEAVV